jgi:hypothetical protein
MESGWAVEGKRALIKSDYDAIRVINQIKMCFDYQE